MKPKNFPARKLSRKIAAKEGVSCRRISIEKLSDAMIIKTKKSRQSKRA